VERNQGPRLFAVSRPRSIITAFLVAATAAVTAAYVFEIAVPGWLTAFSAERIQEAILSWGAWGVAASIALMIVHSFIPFPAEFIAFANGMAYGPVWGTVVTWVGAMLGAMLAFGITRKLGRPLVRRTMTGDKWRALDDWLARQGGNAVFISRFIPVISFNMVNYAAGLTPISWRTFAWTTGLGILPLTSLMVVLGNQSHHMPWPAWLVLLGAALALWPLAQRAMRWSLPSQTAPERDDSAGPDVGH
jgi:uncharacterized membrane protein YdjX (TVP38/TMEM64 family)